jgi:hypothetical protein
MLGKHEKLVAWHNVGLNADDQITPNSDYLLRRPLMALGLTEPAWSLYVVHGDSVLDALGHPWINDATPKVSITNAIALLNLIDSCDMGRFMLPPCALVKSIRHWGVPEGKLDKIPVGLLRAFWDGCNAAEYRSPNNKAAMAHFIKNEMRPVAHWFFSSAKYGGNRRTHGYEDDDYIARILNKGWFGVSSAHSNWHDRERLRREQATPAPAQWDPIIDVVQVDRFKFVALASEDALYLEGRRMKHCAGDYASRCRNGQLRVFSVRNCETGDRVATLSIKELEPGRWAIDELYGEDNRPVREQVQSAAQLFLTAIDGRLCDHQFDGEASGSS